MKITNKANLPAPIVEAVRADTYSKGEADFSVTELLSPPWQAHLKRKHWDELEEDASDRIWALFGQMGHTLLERAAANLPDGSVEFSEKRLFVERNGKKISGQIDLCSMGKGGGLGIQDFKFTSVFTLKEGDEGRREWSEQLNLYAHLARENGYDVDWLEIIAVLRDWRKSELVKESWYPRSNVQTIPIKLWPSAKAEAFLLERLRLHTEEPSEVCSEEERWQRPNKWAVYKKGASRASRLFTTLQEARDFAKDPSTYDVTLREGIAIRCSDYCNVAQFCPYGRKITTKIGAFDEGS